MKSFVFSALVLASMTSVALAGSPGGSKTTKVAPPVQLTNAEMDQVTAGAVALGASSSQGTGGALAVGPTTGASTITVLPSFTASFSGPGAAVSVF
jgi:hypothetical protein